MRKQFTGKYKDIISLENLFAAWEGFIKGKRGKRDVQEFALMLSDNIVQLHEDLANKTYRHGPYQSFHISDPKPRHIHKASVRDRVLHHAIYRKLYPFFDRIFITDSFSCRLGKGTHKAINRFRSFACKVSRNHTKTCWILKCDIRKFFASIDHEVLLEILRGYIQDENVIWLLRSVIQSFECSTSPLPPPLLLPLGQGEGIKGARGGGECGGKGLPLGNLTSQLFCNIYMNEFDRFVKHELRAEYYIRYADDFVLLSDDRERLKAQLLFISAFFEEYLKLFLHQEKIFVKTLASGVDFLGWIYFPHHKVLRSATKRRMIRRLWEYPKAETLQSYLGLLSHGNAYRVRQEVLSTFWLNHLQE